MIEELQDQANTPEVQRVNLIDRELDEAEAQSAVVDQLDLTRAIIDDLHDWNSSFFGQATRDGAIHEPRPDGQRVRAFYLFPHAVTPSDSHEHFLETPQRRIIRVAQQALWDVATDKKNYFWASMSECSFLIVRNSDQVAAAHIGYGQTGDLHAAADHLKEAGFDLGNAVAVINAQPPLSHSTRPHVSPVARHAGPETYQALGLKRENIHVYNYTGQDEEGFDRGLVQLIATPDNVFVYEFDIRQEGGETVHKSSYRNDTVIQLPSGAQ